MKKKTSCYKCINRGSVPGSAHISCLKPNPNMEGDNHGIKEGWFNYPYDFDPVWRIGECENFVSIEPNKIE